MSVITVGAIVPAFAYLGGGDSELKFKTILGAVACGSILFAGSSDLAGQSDLIYKWMLRNHAVK